jgi:hypothetical protein
VQPQTADNDAVRGVAEVDTKVEQDRTCGSARDGGGIAA